MWGLFILSNNIDIKLVPVETYWKNSSAEDTTVCVPFSVLFSWNKIIFQLLQFSFQHQYVHESSSLHMNIIFIYIYIFHFYQFPVYSFHFIWKNYVFAKAMNISLCGIHVRTKCKKKQRREEQKTHGHIRVFSCSFLSCFFCSLTL